MIDSDTSRCAGYGEEHLCSTCERKTQMQRDDPAAFFWRMSPAIEQGRCVYHIPPDAPNKTREVPNTGAKGPRSGPA